MPHRPTPPLFETLLAQNRCLFDIQHLDLCVEAPKLWRLADPVYQKRFFSFIHGKLVPIELVVLVVVQRPESFQEFISVQPLVHAQRTEFFKLNESRMVSISIIILLIYCSKKPNFQA